jgi:hypothetical protein
MYTYNCVRNNLDVSVFRSSGDLTQRHFLYLKDIAIYFKIRGPFLTVRSVTALSALKDRCEKKKRGNVRQTICRQYKM